MNNATTDRDPTSIVDELNALIEQLEQEPDADLREKALSAVQLLIELYGEGLRQIISIIKLTPLKEQILSRMGESELVRALLLIHGLMPVDLHNRVTPAQPLVQIKRTTPDQTRPNGTWIPFVRSQGIEDGQFKIVKFKDVEVLICRIAGEFYAYRNACAAEQHPLDDALYELPMITCSCHGYRYDLRRGSCMERPDLNLEQLPLKIEEERVKIAI